MGRHHGQPLWLPCMLIQQGMLLHKKGVHRDIYLTLLHIRFYRTAAMHVGTIPSLIDRPTTGSQSRGAARRCVSIGCTTAALHYQARHWI